MKTFSYILLMVLLLAVTGLFFIKKPDGRPWLSVNKIQQIAEVKWHEASLFFKDKASETKAISHQVTTSSKTEIYKWQDEQGNWHFSDNSSNKNHAEKVTYDADDVITLPKIDTTILQVADNNNTKNNSSTSAIVNPLTIAPSQVQNLVTDANNIQQLLDKRTKQLKQIQ